MKHIKKTKTKTNVNEMLTLLCTAPLSRWSWARCLTNGSRLTEHLWMRSRSKEAKAVRGSLTHLQKTTENEETTKQIACTGKLAFTRRWRLRSLRTAVLAVGSRAPWQLTPPTPPSVFQHRLNDGQTHDFSTVRWCGSDTHSAGTVL